LFSFDKLDARVLELIEATPHVIGAKAASKLVGVPIEKAIDFIHKLRAHEMTQFEVETRRAPPLMRTPRSKPIVIKDGKSIFAKIENRNGNLVIKLRDDNLLQDLIDQLQPLIRGLLK
jgi:hypothetical protein